MRMLMLVDYYDADGNYVGSGLMEVEVDLNLLFELELIMALLTFEAAFGGGDMDDDWDNDDGLYADFPNYVSTALVHLPGVSVQRREYVAPRGYADVGRIVAEALATG